MSDKVSFRAVTGAQPSAEELAQLRWQAKALSYKYVREFGQDCWPCTVHITTGDRVFPKVRVTSREDLEETLYQQVLADK